ITAAEGWRPQTTQWLKEEYPKAELIEINAAIGGTGSDLGVFRFRRDVLEHKPDLIFVEFAVNDGGAAPEQIFRCMEGMVRQAWRENPGIDICFVYTLVDGWVGQVAKGKLQRAASAMERIAEHYEIPSIFMGTEIVRLATTGAMVMRAESKAAQEQAKREGKIVFSSDGVHPHAETGHRLYTEAVKRSFKTMSEMGPGQAHKLASAFRADNYEDAKMIPLTRAKLSAGWRKVEAGHGLARSFRKYMPELYAADRAGESVTFQFRGRYAGFFDLLGPDCGQLQVVVDGKAETAQRFDAYCTYHRLGSLAVARDVPDGVHRVEVKVDSTKLDKQAILAKRNEKMDDPKRFEGGTWYAGWIMLVGELVE
ncbi:MAG TPA: SGNH/GDSL hydrolase family protein, partial [Tepidisphaeraceae bacterium]|nr:SGNH/GDSL hydrolase family protein [Tepidisphaeraceae bacterium]